MDHPRQEPHLDSGHWSMQPPVGIGQYLASSSLLAMGPGLDPALVLYRLRQVAHSEKDTGWVEAPLQARQILESFG